MDKEDLTDPLVRELWTFFYSYAEHDPDCPAIDAKGPAVLDPATCTCGLTVGAQELFTKLDHRLRGSRS